MKAAPSPLTRVRSRLRQVFTFHVGTSVMKSLRAEIKNVFAMAAALEAAGRDATRLPSPIASAQAGQ
jgi:hypothetical protein